MLKVLKGARILVDCETGSLHMDLGDGKCKPIASNEYDLVLETSAFAIYDMSKDTLSIVSGSFDNCLAKLRENKAPRVLLRVREWYGDEICSMYDIECIVGGSGLNRDTPGIDVRGVCYSGYLRAFIISMNSTGISNVTTSTPAHS